MRRRAGIAALAAVLSACRAGTPAGGAIDLDTAARGYVRLVLALGDRDGDSLDSYYGPPGWQAEARSRHAPLDAILADADALRSALRRPPADGADPVRRAFLERQLDAISARIGILRGDRPSFADESRSLFALDPGAADPAGDGASVREALERELPGRGDLTARYAAFDRRFLVPRDRLRDVLARAIDGCREATRAHVALPPGERVEVAYVRDLPWSAFTRYQGAFVSRIQVNASIALTVDRALDLACHEAYPGHHTIKALLEARWPRGRDELLVQPLFSPQSLLHEAASTLAPGLAFPLSERIAFERDVLFPLAGLDPAEAPRHARVGRLVDRLHPVEARVARQYLDGGLDFPRASAALAREALMPAPDETLKFVNRFRAYVAVYTVGRDRFAQQIAGRWDAYVRGVTDPSQTLGGAGADPR